MNLRGFISFAIVPALLTGLVAPIKAYAQIEPLLPPPALTQLRIGQDIVKAGSVAGLAAIPIQQPELKAQGFLDRIAVAIARQLVQSMVNSTINWINGIDVDSDEPFRGPAYVTEPWKYLGRVADGVVGDYIANNEGLGFLCSPFQAQIKIALVQQYAEEYQPQCTLSDIGVNLENFYDDFDEGGWGAWFSVTQNDSNNPYGSYVQLKADLDSRIANAIGITQDQMRINSGFLSTTKCEAKNPNQDVLDEINFRLEEGESRASLHEVFGEFDLNTPAGACIREGAVRTPGAVIAGQLEKVLSVGGEQLVNADSVDDLLNAVMVKLLSETVFDSKRGLFADTPYNENQAPVYSTIDRTTTDCEPDKTNVQLNESITWKIATNIGGTITTKWYGDDIGVAGVTQNGDSFTKAFSVVGVKNINVDVMKDGNFISNIQCKPAVTVSNVSCSANVTTVQKGQPVVWTANEGSYPTQLYKWAGDGFPQSAVNPAVTNKSVTVVYNTTGPKNARAYFYPTADVSGTPVNVLCSNAVTVVDYVPLAATCSAEVSTAKVGATVHWVAKISGGSGKFSAIEWSGGEETTPVPAGRSPGSVNIRIWPTPSTETLSTVNSNVDALRIPGSTMSAWSYGPRDWAYTNLTDFSSHISTILFNGTRTFITTDVARKYFTTSTTPYGASIRIVDLDPNVAPLVQQCTGGITITP